MNAKQRRCCRNQLRKKLISILGELTDKGIAREFARIASKLSRYEDKHQGWVRMKLGEEYGPILAGHWFQLVPADALAEQAMNKHMGKSWA